jgi:hypothetical protein
MRRGAGGVGRAARVCTGSDGEDGREWRRLLSDGSFGRDRELWWTAGGVCAGVVSSDGASLQSVMTMADSESSVCPTL